MVGIGHRTYINITLQGCGGHRGKDRVSRPVAEEPPVTSVEVVSAVDHTLPLGGYGRETSAPHHLEFAQRIVARRVGLAHHEFDIAGGEMMAKSLHATLDLDAAQVAYLLPLVAVFGDEYLATAGGVYPVHHHAVGYHRRAQVDHEPLVGASGTHPRTGVTG